MKIRLSLQLSLLMLLWIADLSAGKESFPLGALGGRGEVEAGSSEITITALKVSGPAMNSGLTVGDRLIAINAAEFDAHSKDLMKGGRGPQWALGVALDRFAGNSLNLTRLRGDERQEIEVTLPDRASFAVEGFKNGSRASEEWCRLAARQLLDGRTKQGFWDSPVGLTGDRVLTAWAILGLLGHGDPQHEDAVSIAAQWLEGPNQEAWLEDDFMTKGPDNLGNWALSLTAIALLEHQHATGIDHGRPIKRCLQALSERMSPEGLFGHDIVPGYTGKGFNVINTLSHFAWGLGEREGIEINERVWEKSFAQIQQSIDDNGGIRYWTLPGTGTSDASLRTGSMALALSMTGRHEDLSQRFALYLKDHAPRAREAHAVGSMGMMVSAPALWALDQPGWAVFMNEWLWYLSLMRGPDRIEYIGGKGNNGGDSYLGFDKIGCCIGLMMLTCSKEKLLMHRKAKAK